MGGPRLLTPKNAFLSLKPSFPVKSDKSILNVLRGGIPAQENFLNKNFFVCFSYIIKSVNNNDDGDDDDYL